MAMQGPPPPQDYSPLAQHWGEFLVGAWLFWGPPYNRHFWEGNGPVGYVGGPASYTYVSYPGTSAFPPSITKPPANPQAPPPAAPGTGPKQEIPPPPPPITGDQDDPRQDGCGPPGAMAELAAESRLGWGGSHGFASPAVANLSSLPVHSRVDWAETSDPNKYVVYTHEPKVVKDEQGRYQVIHTGKASGVVVFGPPQLFDHHAYGDAVLFDSRFPSKISESTLLLLNSPSATGGNDAISRLAFGTAFQTSAKPKLGWHFEHRPSAGAVAPEALSLYCTDDEAANVAVAADYATFDVVADMRVRGKLTVDGIIDPTGLVLTEQASTPWAFAAGYGALYVKNTAPSTLVFVNDTGGEVTLGAGVAGTELTSAAVLADKAVVVGAAADRTTVKSDFTMTHDGTNVIDVASGSAISLGSNDLTDIGTISRSGNVLQKLAVSAYQGSVDTFTGSAWDQITFDTEAYDTDSTFGSSTYTPAALCKVRVKARVMTDVAATTYLADPDGNGFAIAVYYNGAEVKRGIVGFTYLEGASTSYCTLEVDCELDVTNVAHTIKIYAYSKVAGVKTQGGAAETYFMAHRIN